MSTVKMFVFLKTGIGNQRRKKIVVELTHKQWTMINSCIEYISANEKYVEKLTEAKEIIKGFLDAKGGLDIFNTQRKAEQFLKEVEE